MITSKLDSFIDSDSPWFQLLLMFMLGFLSSTLSGRFLVSLKAKERLQALLIHFGYGVSRGSPKHPNCLKQFDDLSDYEDGDASNALSIGPCKMVVRIKFFLSQVSTFLN